MIKRYLLYLVRWQLSTLILAPCMMLISSIGVIWATILANLIGGLIFFWVDRFIFYDKTIIWDVKDNNICPVCSKVGRGYRLVKAKDYDKRYDSSPVYLCELHSHEKTLQLRSHGVEI